MASWTTLTPENEAASWVWKTCLLFYCNMLWKSAAGVCPRQRVEMTPTTMDIDRFSNSNTKEVKMFAKKISFVAWIVGVVMILRVVTGPTGTANAERGQASVLAAGAWHGWENLGYLNGYHVHDPVIGQTRMDIWKSLHGRVTGLDHSTMPSIGVIRRW
jgi:hypothetical protein